MKRSCLRALTVAAWALAACSSPARPGADAVGAADGVGDAPADVFHDVPIAKDGSPTADTGDCSQPGDCPDPFQHWCDPCSVDGDCAGPGISGAACVATMNEGRFCGTACAMAADCPLASECTDTVSASGTATRQCRPPAGTLCTCSSAAKAAHLPTFCTRSSAAGICAGVRRCLPAGEPGAPAGGGLTACDALTPSAEICDGKDNNCDGITDGDKLCDDGKSCTTDACVGGECDFKAIDCGDGNPCTDDGCDGNGGCTHGPAACSDGNDCTTDACALPGGCTWSAIDGGACSSGLACTAAFCKAGVCTASPLGCEDGDPCTVDSCADAGCSHAPLDCDDGNACTSDSCAPGTGCSSTPNDGNSCSDGDPCTVDACFAGQCSSSPPTCDDGSACTVDSCQSGVGCSHVPACDDGNACTVDTCETMGVCSHTAKSGCALALPYKQKFDCGDASLTAWTLQAPAADGPGWGVDATPGKPGFDSPFCSLNFNNGQDYACPDGVASVQGTAAGPLLDATGLAPGTAISARFAFSGSFEPAPWEMFRVEASTGVAWVPVLTLAAPATLQWSQQKANLNSFAGTKFRIRFVFSTADCLVNDRPGPFVDDLRVGLDQCVVNTDCDDGNACTADLCNTATKACTTQPVSAACDDGNACTTGDTCKNGLCIGSTTSCDDGNACTVDSCDTAGQACTFADVAPGTPCDDNIQCTSNDACLGGACAATALCDDGNSCSFDSCLTGGSCLHVKSDTGYPCDDGDPCTGSDACAAQACVGKPVPCTAAWQDAFACGSSGWSFDPPAQDSQPGWAIDATPAAPGYLSAGCSLNFNNGINFLCAPGQTQAAGTATSKAIDLQGVAAASLHLFSYLDEPAAQGSVAWVEVSDDNFATVAVRHWVDFAVATQKAWLPVHLDLAPVCGKIIRVRLRFASYGCKGGLGAGWFLDDLVLTTSAAGACGDDSACDDGNACTTDACTAGQCTHAGTTGACEDGNVCTFGDTCIGGACVGSANGCDDGLPCTTDGCQPGIGCTHVPVPAATPCPDDDPCTLGESCFGGVCRSTQNCDDGLPCTLDVCGAKGLCSHQVAAAGTPCSDNDACTGADTCSGASCKGIGVACSTLTTFDFACGKDSGWTWTAAAGAHWAIDASPALPAFHSPSCSLNFNNGTDLACLPGQASVKGDATSPVLDLTGASAAQLQFWSYAALADDNGANLRSVLVSTDGFQSAALDVTLTNDPATSGTWQPVKLDLAKFAGKPVQVRLRFDSGGCGHAAGPGWFVDDLRVTLDVAQACATDAACQDSDPCTADTCKSGKCEHPPLSGVPCDDGSVCTVGDSCLGGLCIQSTPLDCDDGNPCSDDACAPASGCLHLPGGEKACSDGSTCTVQDTCHGTACIGVPYDDGTPCAGATICSSKGTCTAGKCLGSVSAPSGTPCDDQDACTVGESCLGGACTGGKPACDDGNPCTLDSCFGGLAGKGACAHKAVSDGAVCDDGDACTAWDGCLGGTCTGTASGCKVAFQDAFDCGGGFGWTLDAPVAGAGWAVDGQPDPPGAKSPSCSLNFGSANGYSALAATSGSAVSPIVNVPAKGLSQLAFWSFGGVAAQNDIDARFVEISDDGFGASLQSSKLDNLKGAGQWTRATVNLSNWAGKAVQVRLRLDSVVLPLGGAPGWFVDDFLVETMAPTTCATASECLPGENPCLVADCIAAKCVLVPAPALPCDDGNACTGPDACSGGSCAGADLCQDGYACTNDFCDPVQGCSHTTVPDCGVVSIPYDVTFTCGGVGVDLWQTLPTTGSAKWGLDASPSLPSGTVQSCALNFNNGKDFACTAGQSSIDGAILSPTFAASGVAPGSPLVARFAMAGVWDAGSADNFDVDVSTDDGSTWTTLASYEGSTTWHAVTLDLSAYAGAIFRLRLRFWTQDCISNGGSGPFVDGFHVFVLTCQSAADCSDGNPCTDDLCDAASGTCSFNANSAACSDGNGCTEKDLCAGGACSGTTKNCSDSNACTDDACDPGSGGCLHTAKADGAACSDGEPCTTSDACKVGICKGIAKADGSVCSDGNGCTTGDACAAGVCTGKGVAADGSLCTDSDPCTASDACKGGMCVGKPACDDGNPCTVDVCEKIDALTKKCSIGGTLCP